MRVVGGRWDDGCQAVLMKESFPILADPTSYVLPGGRPDGMPPLPPPALKKYYDGRCFVGAEFEVSSVVSLAIEERAAGGGMR